LRGTLRHSALLHPPLLQGYFTAILKTLQSICKACGRVLLPEAERTAFLRRLRGKGKERGSNKAVLKKVIDACKLAKQCPHCGVRNGSVKKLVGTYKLVHDPYSKNSVRGWRCGSLLSRTQLHRESMMTEPVADP